MEGVNESNSGGRHPAAMTGDANVTDSPPCVGVNESNSRGRHPAAMTGDANNDEDADDDLIERPRKYEQRAKVTTQRTNLRNTFGSIKENCTARH